MRRLTAVLATVFFIMAGLAAWFYLGGTLRAEPYIRTARVKGLTEGQVVVRHGLRNSLIPVVTVLGPIFAGLLMGSFVVESMFLIPGLGRYFVDSITNLDYPLIMGLTVFYGTFLVTMNLLVDVAYGLLDPRIRAVGVFVDEDPERIRKIAEAGIIDLVQLHGRETPEQVREVQNFVRIPVIKAFSVKTPEDLKTAAESPADFVLLDNGAGGTGTAFDWGILREDQDKTLNRALIEEPNGSRNGFPVCFRRPFFLAGGLTPENVGAAIKRCRPWAVDTSSALETDRKKDPAKMQAFVNAVRSLRPN